MSAATIKTVPPILAGSVALFGGAFLGFSACGGYRWHGRVVGGALAIPLLAAILIPHPFLQSRVRRWVFVCLVVSAFFVASAVGSAFYPTNPSSWGEFLHRIRVALVDGLC